MPLDTVAPILEAGVVQEARPPSNRRAVPLLFGIQSDPTTTERVLSKVNYMLTAIPSSQHKYYKKLLDHLKRGMVEEEEQPIYSQQTQVS